MLIFKKSQHNLIVISSQDSKFAVLGQIYDKVIIIM